MRRAWWLLITVSVWGCAPKGDALGFNRYVIETPYGDGIPYANAVATLNEEAVDICGEDYRKVHDFDTAKGSRRLLVWEIGCRGVERTGKRFGSSNTGEGTSKGAF